MARTFNPGTLRYAVAFALSTGKDLSFEELVAMMVDADLARLEGGS